MNLKVKLARLEKLAGKDSCPSCRLFGRRRQLTHAKALAARDRTLVVSSPCDLCERRSLADLSAHSEHLRELWRLYYVSTLEDKFTDPRAWVAKEGLINWIQFKLKHRRRERASEAMSESDSKRQGWARAWAVAADYKLYAKLRAEYDEALSLKRRHLAAAHGENPFFSLEMRISGARYKGFGHLHPGEPFAVDLDQLTQIHDELTLLLKCAEVDKIVHGHVAPFTTVMIEACEQTALEVIEAGRREHEASAWARRRVEEQKKKRQRESPEQRRGEPAAVAPATAEQTARPDPSPQTSLRVMMMKSGTLAGTQPPPEQRPRPRPVVPIEYPAPNYRAKGAREVEVQALLNSWGLGRRRR